MKLFNTDKNIYLRNCSCDLSYVIATNGNEYNVLRCIIVKKLQWASGVVNTKQ